MSRSNGDRRGKQINGEINGHGAVKIVEGRLIAACGGESVGSPNAKRNAKQLVSRQRRRGDSVLTSKIRSMATAEL